MPVKDDFALLETESNINFGFHPGPTDSGELPMMPLEMAEQSWCVGMAWAPYSSLPSSGRLCCREYQWPWRVKVESEA